MARRTHGSKPKPGWILLITQLPAAPSRDRVAVWRELRKLGAIALGHGTWGVPDVPALTSQLPRVRTLVLRAKGGQLIELSAAGRNRDDTDRLRRMFVEAREEEWTEFLADCDKFAQEIEKETRTQKFTLAELEEEEQSLDRLRAWMRDIKRRSVFGSPSEPRAITRLRQVTARFDRYAERVYDTVHASPDPIVAKNRKS